MPRLIEPGAGGAIELDDLVEALDSTPFDARDEEEFAALGPLLARLGRNVDFLAELAIDELKGQCEAQHRGNGYGAQVFLLRPPNGRYVLRANFWPARTDPVVRASGAAAFFYDLPHDHNFPFLTYGYLGPGYWSDYFEYDVAGLAGIAGEDARLRFVERSRLEPGKLMLYRMRRDIHEPPRAQIGIDQILPHRLDRGGELTLETKHLRRDRVASQGIGHFSSPICGRGFRGSSSSPDGSAPHMPPIAGPFRG